MKKNTAIPKPQNNTTPKPPPEYTLQKFQQDLNTTLNTPAGKRILHYLNTKYQTHLPAYQGHQGNYDPLDAMRRDAHRELLLHIQYHLNQYTPPTQHP